MYYVYFTEDGSICTKFETEELANELINANPNGVMDKIEAPEDHETVNYIWVKNNICIVETQEEIDEEKWITIRQERTKLLLDSDWTDLPSCPLSDEKKTEWQSYRAALRNFPSSISDLDNITWPTKPS